MFVHRLRLCVGAVFALLIFITVAAFRHRPAATSFGLPGDTLQGFRLYDFDAAFFRQPPRKFGPFTRWWWPGNDVTAPELRREVALFADHGFAGVEVQPLFQGLNPKGAADQLQRQFSWDTPSFYEHLRVVLEEARKSGITVDLNAGSGWPLGGPQVSPDSSLLTLACADTVVKGGGLVSVAVPKLHQEAFTVSPKSPLQFYQTVPVSYARLQAVVVARVKKKEGNQTFLDASSVRDMTRKVGGGRLSWQAPAGEWAILSFWSMPDGELPKSIAARPKGFVVDHLDSGKLKAGYNYLLGARTGLQPYFGNPLRSVFNDSYEFMPDRHFTANFLSFFRQQRGYDVVPFLAPNLKKFYNNAYIAPFVAGQPFGFVLGEEDWRLRYDYDLTVSDLLQAQLIRPSNRWLNQKGLLHRTQAYGARMDVIGGSGAADLPEAEQLAGNNSEGFLKLVTSGAHLYNKPLISEEAFVFRGLAEMTTPQKIRLLADKSFAAGINQLIYHGTPYKYQTGEYGTEGWSPFSSPFDPTSNFSSTINESWPFWTDIKTVNQYITRCQYTLQAGRPHTDVLIYFPFIDFYPEQVAANPKEILTGGSFTGVEPEVPAGMTPPQLAPEQEEAAKKWYAAIWPLVNRLEAHGITWEFVNDAALQQASFRDGKIRINGNGYASLVLAHAPYLQLATASKIAGLAKAGARLLVLGAPPARQPSYLRYKENDARTKGYIQAALSGTGTQQVKSEEGLGTWLAALPVQLKFREQNGFTRTIEREMRDGSRIKFIWNQSDSWQRIKVQAADFPYPYWMDAATGSIIKNSGTALTYVLPPYGSVFLLAGHRELAAHLLTAGFPDLQNSTEVARLESWMVKVGDTVLATSPLFDWSSHEALKFRAGKGIYTTSFSLKKEDGRRYLLDLGKVYFTAEVQINGQPAGKRVWAPYQLDITPFVKTGTNNVEIEVTPTYRNGFIGEAVRGNEKYAQFKRKEKTLLPSGLIGPVILKQY
ncbi:glycosyl hydrolase [Paraflavisolibacter sp. H34]|uniref:glycosyl hydrolase n=1 Tax=Huijunlia imazamoxiresistens TaxID=3127457 RepID=UPI003016DBE5